MNRDAARGRSGGFGRCRSGSYAPVQRRVALRALWHSRAALADGGVDRRDLVALGNVRARLRRRADLPLACLAPARRPRADSGGALVAGPRARARSRARCGSSPPSRTRSALKQFALAFMIQAATRHDPRHEGRARARVPARLPVVRRPGRRVPGADADGLDRRLHRRRVARVRRAGLPRRRTTSSFRRAAGRSSRRAAGPLPHRLGDGRDALRVPDLSSSRRRALFIAGVDPRARSSRTGCAPT